MLKGLLTFQRVLNTSILDISSYTDTIPTNHIITTEEGNFSASCTFQNKTPGTGTNPLVTCMSISATGIVGISNTTDAATSNSGALVISGWLGVAKNINCANEIR